MTKYASFRSLTVWQKAKAVAVTVIALAREMPHDRGAEALANQVIRSAASIPANVAEGYGRFADGAYRNHLSIARGSLFETQTWLEIIVDSGYASAPRVQPILAQCDEVGRLLTALMNSRPQSRIREERAFYEVNPPEMEP
jgi:four helix bundle protein